MFDAAAAAYVQNRDRSAMDCVVYHSRLYVTKDFAKSVSTTYDQAGMGECGYYDEPFSEIDWLIVEDSTKTILDYQCVMATTDYHGRKWTVWFTPEIPLTDGLVEILRTSPDLLWRQVNLQANIALLSPELKQAHSRFFQFSTRNMRRWTEKTCSGASRHYRENGNAMFKAATGYELAEVSIPL